MRVVFRFGVYIVTKSVMGLWWFRWIVFSLSCIGLATSLTSSKSFCINYFYFRTKLCCCDFCKCFYKITSKSFWFTSDSTHEYRDKMPTHETACCITIAFWETRKKQKQKIIECQKFKPTRKLFEHMKPYYLE